MDMIELLKELVRRGGSDLHITAGTQPVIRVDGELMRLEQYPVLKPEMTEAIIYSILTDAQKKKLEQDKELDLSFGIENVSRYRGNVFLQRGAIAAVFRVIPHKILTFKELGLPPVVAEFAQRPKGLILITGPTGSGKTTTIASMINKINKERRSHIITIEDPIEFLYNHERCIVNQRQVGEDTHSFQNALKYVLRQDPDIVLVGEMRDRETMQTALTIAETGHLTFATLHTNSAAESITRIVDVFPHQQQPQIRAQLAFVLIGIMTQSLAPKLKGGRVPAVEVLVATPAVKALIRDDKIHQIYSLIQAGRKYGMQTMNQSLLDLYLNKQISMETMYMLSRDPEELDRMLKDKGLS